MALDSLTAKANVGAGTDQLAGKTIDGKFVGAVITTDDSGTHSQIATEATLATLNTEIGLIEGYFKAEDEAAVSGDKGLPMLAMRQVADTTSTDADGDYTLLKVDEEGRAKVATKPASYPLTSGNITAAAGTVALNVSRISNIMVHVWPNPTMAGHNATFEGSLNSTNGTDGNWFAVQAIRSNANTIETATGSLAAAPAYGWELSVNGLNWFRVRATAHTSGTATWNIQPAAYATEPIPAAQVSASQPVASTAVASNVRAGYVAGHGVWYDDSSTALAAGATFTGSSREIVNSATGIAFNTSGTYARELRVSAESDVTGTLWLETSRDNTNWRRVKSVATTAVTGGGFAAEIIHLPSWRYARVGFTNGAGAQARFTIGTILMAA